MGFNAIDNAVKTIINVIFFESITKSTFQLQAFN